MDNRAETTSADRVVPALLVVLALLLVALQYCTLPKFAVFHPATSHVGLARFLEDAARHVDFDWLDALLVSLVAVHGLALVAVEWRRRLLSRFLRSALCSERSALLLLAASSLVGVRYYFAPGSLHWSGDAAQHIAYAHLAAADLWPLPTWTFALGCGSPFLQNYGFLFFYLNGLFALLAPDVESALKLCLALCHVASGMGMYLFARRLCRSRRAGLFAGLAYVLSMWHLQQVLIMGRLPLALFYALLPLPFYALESLADPSRRFRAAAGGALALAGLFFTHPGYGAYAGLLLALYAAARLWSWRGRDDMRPLVGYCALLLAGGALFSGYMTLGMWVERVYTNMHAFEFGLRETAAPISVSNPTWHHLAVWSNYRFWLWPMDGPFHWYGGYMGIAVIGLALVGVAAPKLLRRPAFAPAAFCLFAVLWIVFGYRLPPLSHLQFFQNMNAARYLLFACFFLSVVSAVGVHALLVLVRRRRSGRSLFALLLCALFADLGATTFQHPYMEPGRDPTPWSPELFADIRREAAAYAAQGELPPYRLLWPADGNHYLNVATALHLSQVSNPHAFHPSELRALGDFTDPFVHIVRVAFDDMDSPADFNALPYAAALKSGLFLLDVRHVLTYSQAARMAYFLSFRRDAPVVVAPRLLPYDEERAVADGAIGAAIQAWFPEVGAQSPRGRALRSALWIADRMGVDANRSRSERIYARTEGPARDLGTDPEVEVLAHRVWRDRVELRLRVSAACFARLAYAYFPFLEVRVDGRSVAPLETAGRFMALPLDAGEHHIELRARLSPLRRGLLVANLLLLLPAGWMGYREWRVAEKRRVAYPKDRPATP